MRLELKQRFCGRCGKPCDGYWEHDDTLDPPSRCAECCVETTRGVGVRLCLLAMGLFTAAAGGLGATLYLGVMAFTMGGLTGGASPSGLALFLFLALVAPLTWFLFAAAASVLRLARQESRDAARIRRRAEGPNHPRGRPKNNHRWFGTPESRFRFSSFVSPVWGPPPADGSPWDWPEK